MKTNLATTALKAVCLAFLVTNIVACKFDAQSSGPSVSEPVGTDQTGSPQSNNSGSTRGPGDSGSNGGNGIDNKVYEAFVVDVTSLPAYKNHLKPILEGIIEFKPEDTPEKKAKLISAYMNLKAWYIAPVTLKPLDKEVIGLSLADGTTQQLALQTEHEIWVDQTAWEKMSEQDQASLILHEFVMQIYLMRFLSFYDICVSYQGVGVDGCDLQNIDKATIDKSYPPEPKRPLVKADYAHIRFVTSWLLRNADQLNAATVRKLFYSRNFDKRFFSPENEEEYAEKELKVSGEQLENTLMVQAKLGRMPSTCIGLKTGIKFDCQISIKKDRTQEEVKAGEHKFSLVNETLVVSLESEKFKKTFKSRTPSDFTFSGTLDTLHFSLTPDSAKCSEVESTQHSFVNFVLEPTLTYSNDGKKTREFTKASSVQSIALYPLVATHIHKAEEGQFYRKVDLHIPKANSLENDIIIVYEDEKALANTEMVAKMMEKQTLPSFCNDVQPVK